MSTKRAKVLKASRSKEMRLPGGDPLEGGSVPHLSQGSSVILEPDGWPDDYAKSFAGMPDDFARPPQSES
jgi:virulence-associated protein VagC